MVRWKTNYVQTMSITLVAVMFCVGKQYATNEECSHALEREEQA